MASKNSPFSYLAEQSEDTPVQQQVVQDEAFTVQQLIEALQKIVKNDPSVASYKILKRYSNWNIDTITVSEENEAVYITSG